MAILMSLGREPEVWGKSEWISFVKADCVNFIALNPIPLKRVVKKLSFHAAKLLLCGSGVSACSMYICDALVSNQAGAE